MQRREFMMTAAAATLVGGAIRTAGGAEGLPRGVVEVVEPDAATGAARAVVVGDVPLVHTEQITAQTGAAALDRLDEVLQNAGSSLGDVVRLHFYGPAESLGPSLAAELSRRFTGRYRPAVTYVATSPFGEGRPLAVDCVAASSKSTAPGRVLRLDGAAILPPSNKLYVSGDASPGPIDVATRGTLESLEKTLAFCGLDWSHVVQLKSFLQPLGAAADVRSALAAFFGTRPVPMLSFVEWRSSEKIPIEIELIAAVPPELGNKNGEPVEYLTPPHMTSSPVFSRAARISSPQTIYVGGLYGESADPEAQVRDIFGQLKHAVEPLRSDLRHLVKATYYVADDPVSKALGTIRPEFYDPKRPPAASKALVSGTGRKDRTLTLDMIAVPRRKA